MDFTAAGGVSRERHSDRTALLGAQRQLLGCGRRERARSSHGDGVIARLAFDIVEIEMKARVIARQEEAR